MMDGECRVTSECRQAVVILGMHRGGTSALAGTVVRLGFAPPRHVLPPASDNPTGFYESIPVTALNDRILEAVGCSWIDCLTFDPASLDATAQAAAQAWCTRIVRDDFGDADRFVLKDPRLCLTLPVWLPALRAAGARTPVLLMLRHPAEAARSLAARDGTGMRQAMAVWLHHMLEAERATRFMPRAAVFFDSLLHDWRGCLARAGRQARIDWPAGHDCWAPVQVDLFLRESLRHHVADALPAPAAADGLDEMLASAWTLFRTLEDEPRGETIRPRLDALHRRFAAWRQDHTAANLPARTAGMAPAAGHHSPP